MKQFQDELIEVIDHTQHAYMAVRGAVMESGAHCPPNDAAQGAVMEVMGICVTPCGKHFSCILMHQLSPEIDWWMVARSVVDSDEWHAVGAPG